MDYDLIFPRLCWNMSLWNSCFFQRHGFAIIMVTCNQIYYGVPVAQHGHLAMLFPDGSLKFVTNENLCRSVPMA